VSSRAPAVPDRAYTVTIGLRWGDMDRLGHINNVVFLQLLEEARVQFFTELRPTDDMAGVTFVAARHEIDYLSVLHYSTAPITVRMWLDRIGGASFTVAYVMDDPDGRAVAAARTVIVAIDPDSGRAVPLPDALRGRGEAFLVG
jgi:acyl-CoA thioester hydrolase